VLYDGGPVNFTTQNALARVAAATLRLAARAYVLTVDSPLSPRSTMV